VDYSKILSILCSPLSMIVHAMAAQPAKNAGALIAVNAISGALPLIHGPMGCATLRKINSFSIYSFFPHTPCTNMKEVDLVYGAGDRLDRAIIEAYEKYNPSIIVVIPTCPSDMIGDDIASAVNKASKEVKCKVVYSTGELIKGRPIGYHDVVYSILDQLLPEGFKVNKKSDSVNIITFPIHSSENKMSEFQNILIEMGININKIFFYNTKVEDIYELPKAQLNITDSSAPWLSLIEKRFGIPYYLISSLEHMEYNPYGIEESSRVFMDIADRFGKKDYARNVIEAKREDAKFRLQQEIRDIQGIRIAVVGGFFFGMGSLFMKDLKLKPVLLIYKTYGLESHGMSKDTIKKIIDMDLNMASQYGIKPQVLVNPTYIEEIKAIKNSEIDIVIAPSSDIPVYHQKGIRAFDSLKFYANFLKIGFECPILLSKLLKKELSRKIKRTPLVCMIDHDLYRSDLHPSWIKAEKVWRKVTEGTDGGCLYG